MRLFILTAFTALLFCHSAYAQSHAKAEAGCVIGGCSAELCLNSEDEPMTSTCEWKEEYACYAREGVCKQQADGQCGWEMTDSMKTCLANPPQMQEIPALPQ